MFKEVFLKPDGGECMFTHALVRDAIYTSLLKSDRTDFPSAGGRMRSKAPIPIIVRSTLIEPRIRVAQRPT